MSIFTIVLLVLFALLNIADAVTTHKNLQIKGHKEGNPLVAWVMDKLGVTFGLVVVKALVIALMVWIYTIVGASEEFKMVLSLADLMYAFVVISNINRLKAD